MVPPRLEKDDHQPLLTRTLAMGRTSRTTHSWSKVLLITAVVILASIGTVSLAWSSNASSHSAHSDVLSQELQSCAWKHLKEHASLLDVAPISYDEFLKRQSTLAAALDEVGVDAFIAEPSTSTSYYANISTSYELSERPFLMILDRKGQFSYLGPKFELNRIAGLQMVYQNKKVIEWREEDLWYEVLQKETGYKKIMLDEHARFMIASGLQTAGVEVVPTSHAIQSLRAVKSEAELTIMKGINRFTLELVRSLQKCIRIGVTQSTIKTAAHGLFTQAGIGKDFWTIVLFGDQAANPHGGAVGKTLSDGEFVLIDIGSNLHGYGSDVTRTILPRRSTVSKELMDIWWTVHRAQGAAIELMSANETCSVVDAASRDVIEKAGYGEFFTHRLGHGLGLEMHEHPYLNGANDEKLKAGEVVTNEPVSFGLWGNFDSC